MNIQLSNVDAWDAFLAQADDATIAFAATWAMAMEREIAQDTRRDPASIGNIARATVQAAGREFITDEQYNAAVAALSAAWAYGDAFGRGMAGGRSSTTIAT